ncbi:hypothetical protein H310_10571 [Aphanomyces invadans]|uniref:Chromo domain-containing protein n=1 Tax=Aphanomyces invadans TaxID=157072 RepID=A0A024TQN1_9STRA|nr:hypothetical protein H310_10571 [Aphanomyces invadans]ETV95906.1 hypothetical protein H310_10571 [Aphanomyces invadans]|eukprot:XP_008875217.1 hypothetical protein H310_10571 [Aphanomyces invadans]
METQQLVAPFDLSAHHTCRLKMYHEGGREATDDLVDRIAFGDGGFHVERLEEVRVAANGRYEVLVKWLGLDAEESSWEPAANLLEDIPVALRKCCTVHKDDAHVADMMANLGLPEEREVFYGAGQSGSPDCLTHCGRGSCLVPQLYWRC